MKFYTESLTRSAARLGKLTDIERLPQISFETPLLLLYTKRGSVPHLCKDILKMMTVEQQFLLTSLPSTILMSEVVAQYKSFGEFVSLQEYPFFLTVQDPTESGDPASQKKNAISVWSRNGRFSLNVEKYMNIVEIFKPDMYVTLCDGYTDKDSSHKRIIKAVDKSKQFFEKCLDHHLKSDILKNKGFLGAIEGGYNLHEREKSIKSMQKAPILGFVIDGLHRNGFETSNINIDQVKHVIEHSLNLLPTDKMRVLMGSWNPVTILDLVDLGIDVFESSYPYLIAEQTKALIFLCNNCQHKGRGDFINLSDKIYADDFDPICKSCHCLTCKNHSKAYIHHLHQTKELLLHVLLMIHNTHHYMEFFKAIRLHITSSSLHNFRDTIQSKYSSKNEKPFINNVCDIRNVNNSNLL